MLNRAEIFPRLLAAILVFALAPPTWAGEGEVSPALLRAATDAYQQAQQQEPEILPPARVDPKLVGKKVVVHCRDGRIYQGKLMEVRAESLSLRVGKRTQQLTLNEVATVERQPPRGRTWKVATAVAVIATVVTAIFAKLVD